MSFRKSDFEQPSGSDRRIKRSWKEENMWDCSVCTYRNSAEAFKCLMCDVRKGTSTRKPRLNAELVAAQVAQVVPKPKKSEKKEKEKKHDDQNGVRDRPRLKNVDRSTAQHNAVTVNNVTVIITEFQPKQRKSSNSGQIANGDNSFNLSSSEAGSISDTSIETRNGEVNEARSS